jgi:hypothetical protein
MKKSLCLLALSIFLGACGAPTGKPVEYSKACDHGNDKKTIETAGFLDSGTGLFCSNTSGRMECGFKLKNELKEETGFTADIAVGSGANSMDKVERGYQKSDLKVRGNDGSEVDLNKRVSVTGKLTSVDDATDPTGGVCYMKVYKVEQK